MMEKNSKIAVFGSKGLVGSAIVRKLKSLGYENLLLVDRTVCDLLNQSQTEQYFEQYKPEFAFDAAAKVGGIMANKTQKADYIYQNLQIQNNIIYNSWKFGVKKLLFLGSSCIYPKMSPQPVKEESLLSGYLEESNDAYAIAKIAGIKMCQSFNNQYKTNFISAMPTNLYGPGDNYDLQNGHVLPAMMRKFYEGKINNIPSITFWGTGSPYREFLHVDDLAEAVVHLMDNYNDTEIINVGTGEDLTIKQLAEAIKGVVGYEGEILWDSTKPDGTPKKQLDVTKLHSTGWKHKICLEEGLKSTYKWFIENYEEILAKENDKPTK